MVNNKREDSLDILKGLACLAMVIAHQPYYTKTPDLILGIINHLVSGFPPPLFFAIAGITASLQSQKYSLTSLARYFIAMFFIGITWNITIHGDITAFYWPEIFQTIALGSLLVCCTERKGAAPQWLLFSIAAGIILIKVGVEIWLPQFDGFNYLFCDTDYLPEIEAPSAEKLVLPGFPLFPWLAYFFIGVWCYRCNKKQKLLLSIVFFVLALISVYLGSSAVEKWDSSIAHIFSNCALTFILLWLFDGYSTPASIVSAQLKRIGSNAFLFFFAHPFGIVVGVIIYATVHNAYVAWLVSVIISILMYNLLGKLKPMRTFESGYAWLIMIAVIVLIPLLPSLIEHKSMPVITRLLAISIGTIAAINFSSLSRLTKTRKVATT